MSNRTKKAKHSALREAAGLQSTSNKHITRISAKPSSERERPTEGTKSSQAPTSPSPAIAEDVLNSELVTAPEKTSAVAKAEQKSDKSKNNLKKPQKGDKTEKPLKEVFILARPFVALGRYLRDSWREIRQVRWPNRKLTWKMTFAVLVYCAIFIVFIVLLDMFFTFIFNLLINA